MQFQTCCPKIRGPWHVDCFKLEEPEKQSLQGRLPEFLSPLKQVMEVLWEVPSLFPKEWIVFISKDGRAETGIWMNRLCSVSPTLLALVYSFCPITFLHNLPLSSNLVPKPWNLSISLGLHFLMKVPLSINLILKKLLCYSLVSLSFVNLTYRAPAGEPRRTEEKDIFFLPYTHKAKCLDSYRHGRQFKCVPHDNLWLEIVMSSKLLSIPLPETINLKCHYL